ncbi:MAG: hypothetical protein R2751_10795 [Bacteroidales bacterium]
MRRTLLGGFVGILTGCSLLLSCSQNNRGGSSLMDDVGGTGQEGDITSFSQIYHLYPSPAEMLSIIDMAEMAYDGELLARVDMKDKYLTTKAKTSMLGVYMTDLAYSALFGRHEATLNYLELVRDLAEDIRIDEAVSDAMIQKARDNVDYLDSLYQISNEAFMNIIAFCERNERSNTVVMLSAGAFTESLYLAVNLIDNHEEADYLLQHLADQKYTLDNFMAFAVSVDQEDNVSSTIADLKTIKEIYDGMDPGSGKVTVTTGSEDGESAPKKLVIGGSGDQSQPSLSRDEFFALEEAVVALRNKIIEGQN